MAILKVRDVDGWKEIASLKGSDATATDVRINGSSIVVDGVADIQIASPGASGNSIPGLFNPSAIFDKGSDGRHSLVAPKSADFNNRTSSKAILVNTIDAAVKAAMCDGKGAAWTDAERLAARQRIGLGGDFELIEEITIGEGVHSVIRNATPDGKNYKFKEIIALVENPGGNNTQDVFTAHFGDNSISMYSAINASRSYKHFYIEKHGLAVNGYCSSYNSSSPSNIGTYSKRSYPLFDIDDDITSIRYASNNNSYDIPAGTIIRIYGAWA